MTGKKLLGLVILLMGAGTFGYLAIFNVNSGLLGVCAAVAAIVGYTLLFGFATGRKGKSNA